MTVCDYCAHTVSEARRPDSDEGWALLGREHAPGCEWVLTQAHTKEHVVTCRTLSDLAALLNGPVGQDAESLAAAGVDLAHLPTYGGDRPAPGRHQPEALSWDALRVLYRVEGHWVVRPRLALVGW